MGDSPVWTADSETENDEPSAKGSGGKGKGSDEKGKSDKGKSWGVLPGSNAKGSGPSPSAKSSGDSSSVAKGKSKSRGEMAVEEKKVANLKNATKAKKSKTAANLAKSSKDAGWVVPRVADGQFKFPPGHRLSRTPPRVLRKNVAGLLRIWKQIVADARQQKRSRDLWMGNSISQWAPEAAALESCRAGVSQELLTPLGMEAWPCVKDLQTAAGREAAMKHVLWPGGPKLEDLPGDAMPSMVPLTVPDDDAKHTVWDLHFTNYDPRF